MTVPDENTAGIDEARKALAESRRASVRTDHLLADARVAFARVKIDRETNHFAERFRRIIRGAA